MLKRQVSLLNVYFRNRKQTSSIALHCFWASFSRQSNEPRILHSLIASALTFELGLLFHSSFAIQSLIVTQFHFEAKSGFGEQQPQMEISASEEFDDLDDARRRRRITAQEFLLMQFWDPNLIDCTPHTSASSRSHDDTCPL